MLERLKQITLDNRPTKIYLACPYSHPCKQWEEIRFNLANIAAMTLINAGFVVFSPLSHSHPISLTQPGSSNTHALWLGQDLYFLEWADVLAVLAIPGWVESYGVKWEGDWFRHNKKPIFHVRLEEIYALQQEQLNGRG